MANSGRTNQPGGRGGGRNAAMDTVKDIAAAWRGDRVRTRVTLEGAPDLDGLGVTIGDRTMVFAGSTLNFYLRPGTHEASLDDEALEVTEVNGEAGTEFGAGDTVTLTVAEIVE